MRHGFVKVAAATPDIRVADVEFNKENICRGIEEAEKANAKIPGSTFFDPVNSLVTGDKTEDDWVNQIKTDSDKLRAALK